MLCVTLAGCAGSLKPAAGASGPTKAAYIAEADAICKAANAKIEKLIPVHFTSAGPGPYAHRLEASVRVQREALAALRELPKPDGGKATLAAIWNAQATLIEAHARSADGLSQLAQKFAAITATFKAGRNTITQIFRGPLPRHFPTIDETYGRLAKRYGFKYCNR